MHPRTLQRPEMSGSLPVFELGQTEMTIAEIRESLAREIERIPDDRLGEVFNVLHYFRIGLESTACPAAPAKRHRPSARLAGQGARLRGDDMIPAIPLEDWGGLYEKAI